MKFPEAEFVRRIWRKDPKAFPVGPEAHPSIVSRLGWLEAPGATLAAAGEVESFAAEAAGSGFRTAVILGMGGSSLCPLVLSRAFPVRPGFLRVEVADTTSPAVAGKLMRELDPASTLFIVSSKSGTTVEPLSLYALVREWISHGVKEPGKHFAAITDPGSPLEKLAGDEGFRKLFRAPADVGGRFSALTVFGMVPAALMGIDIRRLLGGALEMAERCGPGIPSADNPGVILASWIAEQALAGRDKLTLLMTPEIGPLALWLEQLLAESTGKEGRGVIPVAGEPPAPLEDYGRDRAFVGVSLTGHPESDEWRALRRDGAPFFRVGLESLYDLGAEFYRWEMTTAALGAFLGVNPFDEPNVTESKKNTQAILDAYAQTKAFPGESPGITADGAVFYPPRDGKKGGSATAVTARDLFARFLSLGRPGDYLSVLAFLPYGEECEAGIADLRRYVMKKCRLATTFGYGPRYLHSTGQIHKGGPETGVFLFITEDECERLPVHGQPYSLGELQMAQALGDEESLRRRGRPVMRIHLPAGGTGLAELVRYLTA